MEFQDTKCVLGSVLSGVRIQYGLGAGLETKGFPLRVLVQGVAS